MTLALCLISYALGLLSVYMFCDHYSLISSSLTSAQIKTCTSYYENVFYQPGYTLLAIVLPILLGAIVLFRNIKRTIYDILSVPLFIAIVALLLHFNLDYLEALVMDFRGNDHSKEGYLRQIAYIHVIIGVLLLSLLVLQGLAARKVKRTTEKNL